MVDKLNDSRVIHSLANVLSKCLVCVPMQIPKRVSYPQQVVIVIEKSRRNRTLLRASSSLLARMTPFSVYLPLVQIPNIKHTSCQSSITGRAPTKSFSFEKREMLFAIRRCVAAALRPRQATPLRVPSAGSAFQNVSIREYKVRTSVKKFCAHCYVRFSITVNTNSRLQGEREGFMCCASLIPSTNKDRVKCI